MNLTNFIEKNNLGRRNTEEFLTYNRMVPVTDHAINVFFNESVFLKSTSHQLYTAIQSIIRLLSSTDAWYIKLEMEKTMERSNLIIKAFGNHGKLTIFIIKLRVDSKSYEIMNLSEYIINKYLSKNKLDFVTNGYHNYNSEIYLFIQELYKCAKSLSDMFWQ